MLILKQVIDFHPGAKNHIGLVEIEAVHIYTYGNSSGGANWSPIMLELRDVHYEEFNGPVALTRKPDILARFKLPPTRQKIVEFLYLNGWNWGRNGQTNAAFIHDAPRRYFQRVFNTDLGVSAPP